MVYVVNDGVEYSFSFMQDITDRKRAQERMTASLREKESLLQEVHHRVKNNLAVISSLISLQLADIGTQEEAVEAMEKTRDRINTMGEVHNNLNSSDDFSGVDFCAFARNRAQSLSYGYRGYRDISIAVECETCRLDVAVAVPLGLILNELIINAFRHAFPEDQGGTITVGVAVEETEATLTVRDNGCGLGDDTDSVSHGMGFQLVRLLTEQVGGSFELSRAEGTQAELRFPVSGVGSR